MRTDGPESPPILLPRYPHATTLTATRPPRPDDVSFTGRFADTRIQSLRFVTDDDVDLVLRFYREAMREHGAPLGCRGTINVRAQGHTEELRCIHRAASESVQLVVSVPGDHAVVSVAPAATGSTFTLMNVRTRH